MVKMTLDFSTSYRAITDADITHGLLFRQAGGFDGSSIPIHQVTFTDPAGDYVIPASEYQILTPYQAAHTASANQFDLSSDEPTALNPYLRFSIAVEGPPLYENYVQATYPQPTAAFEWGEDYIAFLQAMSVWDSYILDNPFRASAATLTDDGGLLGQFSSNQPTLIENFTETTNVFSSIIRGSNFDDTFSAGDLPCTLRGGNGDDNLFGGAGNDGIFGDAGVDILFGAAGNDVMFGGNDSDRIVGGVGSDFINGGSDDDFISGSRGNDNLVGSVGNDRIDGDIGNDSLRGGGDNDTLQGGAGADTLAGEQGDDALSGGAGKDVLYGGDGVDFIRGGLGRDTLTGGAGRDTFNFNFVGTANADLIVDFLPGADRIALTSAAFAGLHGSMDAQEFRRGTAAADGDDRIIYDQATGRLFYDSDGTLNGALSAPAVVFAIVGNHAALSFQDFFVL